MKIELRDQIFRFNGIDLYVDTHVLPALQVSLDGKKWTQGAEIEYLAKKFGIRVDDLDSIGKLQNEFRDFSGYVVGYLY